MWFWSKKQSKKEYPDFWNIYESIFEKKLNQSTNKIRFVAFDTETTGFDYKKDRVLSIGAIAIKNNVIEVSDQLETYLDQEVFNADTVEIHGILKNHSYQKVSEKIAIQSFINYIGDAILIAHHADFDRNMINKVLERQGLGKLKNTFLDTGVLFKKTKHFIYQSHQDQKHYSLDELCSELNISKSDRHTASGDAFITAMAFLKIAAKLKKEKGIEIKDLIRR